MSTRSFINSIIGLARDHRSDIKKLKKLEDRLSNEKKIGKSGGWCTEAELDIRKKLIGEFGKDFAEEMILTGYFDEESSVEFGKALQKVLETSFPTRKKKT